MTSVMLALFVVTAMFSGCRPLSPLAVTMTILASGRRMAALVASDGAENAYDEVRPDKKFADAGLQIAPGLKRTMLSMRATRLAHTGKVRDA